MHSMGKTNKARRERKIKTTKTKKQITKKTTKKQNKKKTPHTHTKKPKTQHQVSLSKLIPFIMSQKLSES